MAWHARDMTGPICMTVRQIMMRPTQPMLHTHEPNAAIRAFPVVYLQPAANSRRLKTR